MRPSRPFLMVCADMQMKGFPADDRQPAGEPMNKDVLRTRKEGRHFLSLFHRTITLLGLLCI